MLPGNRDEESAYGGCSGLLDTPTGTPTGARLARRHKPTPLVAPSSLPGRSAGMLLPTPASYSPRAPFHAGGPLLATPTELGEHVLPAFDFVPPTMPATPRAAISPLPSTTCSHTHCSWSSVGSNTSLKAHEKNLSLHRRHFDTDRVSCPCCQSLVASGTWNPDPSKDDNNWHMCAHTNCGWSSDCTKNADRKVNVTNHQMSIHHHVKHFISSRDSCPCCQELLANGTWILGDSGQEASGGRISLNLFPAPSTTREEMACGHVGCPFRSRATTPTHRKACIEAHESSLTKSHREHFQRHKTTCPKCIYFVKNNIWSSDGQVTGVGKDDYICRHVGCGWHSSATTAILRHRYVKRHEKTPSCHAAHYKETAGACPLCKELISNGSWKAEKLATLAAHPTGKFRSSKGSRRGSQTKTRAPPGGLGPPGALPPPPLPRSTTTTTATPSGSGTSGASRLKLRFQQKAASALLPSPHFGLNTPGTLLSPLQEAYMLLQNECASAGHFPPTDGKGVKRASDGRNAPAKRPRLDKSVFDPPPPAPALGESGAGRGCMGVFSKMMDVAASTPSAAPRDTRTPGSVVPVNSNQPALSPWASLPSSFGGLSGQDVPPPLPSPWYTGQLAPSPQASLLDLLRGSTDDQRS